MLGRLLRARRRAGLGKAVLVAVVLCRGGGPQLLTVWVVTGGGVAASRTVGRVLARTLSDRRRVDCEA